MQRDSRRTKFFAKEATIMDKEVLIAAAFLGPSISGCEVEEIAAGQTRRG
jgi:hypothetical protein